MRKTELSSTLPADWKSAGLPEILPKELGKRHPREHQQEAINAAVNYLSINGNNNCRVTMACGTGKTLVLNRATEALGERTLCGAPSLGLVRQNYESWKRDGDSERYKDVLIVCSDESIININEDNFSDDYGYLKQCGAIVTTDPQVIAEYLSKPGKRTVFSTYQSCDKIAEAYRLQPELKPFDAKGLDEAHRTTGAEGSIFTTILDREKIPSIKHLFVTATEVVIKESQKDDSPQVFSMDNEKVYGPRVYNLPFGEAIKRGLLTDYEVVISVIDEDNLPGNYKPGLEASLAIFLQTAKDHDLTNCLSFYNSVARAKSAASLLPEIAKNIEGFEKEIISASIDGTMPTKKRKRILSILDNNTEGNALGVISNCRCLSEGVDLPGVDGIFIGDKRSSSLEIVQIVGRGMRLSPNKVKGTIIIPVVMKKNEDIETALNSSEFKKVWQVISALSLHDDRLLMHSRSLVRKGDTEHETSRDITNEFEGLPIKIEGLTVSEINILRHIKTRIIKEVATVARSLLPQFDSETDIACSVIGLYSYFIGDSSKQAQSINALLSEEKSNKASILGYEASVTFEKKKNRAHEVWTISKKDKENLAKLMGWSPAKDIEVFNSETDIACSAKGVNPYFIGDSSKQAQSINEQLSKEEGNKATIQGNEVSVTFEKKKNGKHEVWTIGKKDKENLAKLMGWRLAKDIEVFNSETDIACSVIGLRPYFVGDSNEQAPLIRELLSKEEGNKATIQGNEVNVTFEKKKNRTNEVWTINKTDKENLAKLMGWSLPKEIEVFNFETDIACSVNGLIPYFIGNSILAQSINGQLSKEEGNKVTLQGNEVSVTFEKKKNGKHHEVWTIGKTDKENLAKLMGWSLAKDIEVFNSETDIACSTNGLIPYFIGIANKLAQSINGQLSKEEGNKATLQGNNAIVTFEKKKNGAQEVWTINKIDKENLAKLMGWRVR